MPKDVADVGDAGVGAVVDAVGGDEWGEEGDGEGEDVHGG